MSRATVPNIALPQSLVSKQAIFDNDQITGLPPALAPGSDSFSTNMNSLSESVSVSRVTSHNEALKMELPHRCVCSNPILEPKPGIDVVALIFILLLLPQSWCCLMLTSYILSGSFKSLFGKFLSRFLVQSDNYSYLFVEERTKSRAIYYRSELLGEFLQLFSINSFILLLCRFIFPRAWLRYLSVLAKSIIAGKLVGTNSTGSTTYVSVMSNNSTNTASVTTTTTTNSGHASSKALPNISCSDFGNFITGFAFVIATDYIKDRTSGHLEILSRFSALFLSSSGELFNQILLYSSSKNLSRNSSSCFEESKLLSTKESWMTNTVIRVFRKLFRISGRSIRGVNHLSHDLVVIINFAYLVLCIHVISLTVSPILRRIFILKDYSRTLDHLACITPDVPYGGLKKSGAAFATLRDSVSDSIVVINMEQSASHQLTNMAPFEIKVDYEISRVPIKTISQNHIKSTTAENFKFFCMRLPAMKTLVPGSKQNHTRTIVDRKRSNSSTCPATTIMDKYFTVSTQPLWAWIAAIKILIVAPILFSGRNLKSEKQHIQSLPINGLQLALSSVGKFELIFQVLDHAISETLIANLSVQVNNEPWLLVDILKTNSFTKSQRGVFISVFGLSPSCCYKVEFLDKDQVIGHHAVSTASYNEISHGYSKSFSDTDLLRSSLMSSLSKLVEMRAGFKKEKKEESKRIADLRRKIDSLIAKSEKYGSAEAIESRIGGKLKGLQNSVTQLENEINELEKKVSDRSSRGETFQIDFESEELKLKQIIFESEKLVHEWDTKANNSKLDAKGITTERETADSRLRKIEDKFKAKHEELSKIHGDVKSLKRVLVSKIKKRQEELHDRIECMVWKIDEAIEKLRDELWRFSHSKN